MNKENFRFYIKARTALGIQPTIIHDELCTVFSYEAPSFRTVARWSQSFREGREEIEDEARAGRPITETTSENIELVQSIINDDSHITIEELEAQTDLSHGTIQRIISDHLNLRKITARYLPKDLTDFQRAERVRICRENLAKFESGAWRLCDVVTGDESWFNHKRIGRKSSNSAWVARGDSPPTVVRHSRFSPKTLFSIFFKSTGPVLIHYVEQGETIDHQYYIDYCLEPLINNIKKQRPSCGVQGIKLHHDNGRPHVHHVVSEYLESEGITVIPHPSNSPDLSPCDFWLFDLIKQNLADQNNSESLYRAVSHFMNSLNKEEYRKTFDKWIQRMQLCVDNNGDYFEHLMK
jgi:histone-lysine N-methyltransferase SETMAR